MDIFRYKKDIRKKIESFKPGTTIGFVPTMGALHKGHLSLIECSVKQDDVTIVSIFVNPAQFNDKNDFKNYPKTLDTDLKVLSNAKCDIVFVPSENEMYDKPDHRIFDFGNLGKVMEGKYRPGHFSGVAKIVTRLFDVINPHKAYFGLKDFQQFAIIKKLTEDLKLPVNIIPCPTVRENDGLAMSSRNSLLSAEERKHAALIYSTLFQAKKDSRKYTVGNIKKNVSNTLNEDPYITVEYFEIVNASNLAPVQSWNEPSVKVGCIAAKVGNVRLIDNINFNS
ncbi:MAG: pantoate--beta-alanine ligase [Bacteroidales bacterium]|nr:MAG: pantoate--beta-alanine ligase [Bacteroidales bacterium]